MVRLLVLQTLPRPTAYSPSNALLTLARGLDRSRLIMTVATPRRGLLTEALEAAGVATLRVPGLSTYRRHDALWRLPSVAFRLTQHLRNLQADLLLSNHAELGPFAHAAGRLTGTPWICMLRQADRPRRYYEKYRVGRADAVAAVSSAALEGYRACATQDRALERLHRVIPTGIALPSEGPEGRAEIPPTIGTVGLRSVKRPELFLRIVGRVHRTMPGVRALAVGGAEAPVLAELEALGRELGIRETTTFPGQQKEMRPWYDAMSVYAHTSRSEALPKAVLEAMGHGLPVVAFRVGGNREAVAEGVSGFLIEEGNEEEFAEALLRLLSNPDLARRMGRAGRTRVAEQFSEKRMTEEMMALFEETVGARREMARTGPRGKR
ncbi:MAG TPA: glycosyltransferase family 4 protein [Candidatus Polarisedimenticolia bacterium]|nr:glycosyltransferase family 4 protein [Candidatus Polarisedimenticolia bacterium]